MILRNGSIGPIVVLFWLLVNLFNLVMATFFVLGRKFHRKSERVAISEPVVLKTEYEEIICETLDISEGGISIWMENPIFIDEKNEITLAITTDHYHAEVTGKLVHVDEFKDGWKYAFQVEEYQESKADYMQMLYDRVHTLPKSLQSSHSTFDDLRLNIVRRMQPTIYFNRKSARIDMDEKIPLVTGGFVTIVNFNFEYFVTNSHDVEKEFECVLPNDVHFKCKYVKNLNNDNKLYQIVNIDEIAKNSQQMLLVTQWAQQARKTKQVEVEPQTDDTNLLVNDILGGVDDENHTK